MVQGMPEPQVPTQDQTLFWSVQKNHVASLQSVQS